MSQPRSCILLYIIRHTVCLFFPPWCCLCCESVVSAAHTSRVCQNAVFHSKLNPYSVYFWLRDHSLSPRGCNSCQTVIVLLWINIDCRLSPLECDLFISVLFSSSLWENTHQLWMNCLFFAVTVKSCNFIYFSFPSACWKVMPKDTLAYRHF